MCGLASYCSLKRLGAEFKHTLLYDTYFLIFKGGWCVEGGKKHCALRFTGWATTEPWTRDPAHEPARLHRCIKLCSSSCAGGGSTRCCAAQVSQQLDGGMSTPPGCAKAFSCAALIAGYGSRLVYLFAH